MDDRAAVRQSDKPFDALSGTIVEVDGQRAVIDGHATKRP